ncbi:MAG: hypothetical protein DRG09_04215 [Epsilonproteobacteria bacterium]|nr:MAG: hypothetical protein DRG09_04215 [Campylobacterota bacterium]
MKTIDAVALNNLEKETYTLIHVLPKEHYKNLHIKGALNICVYEVSFFDKIKALNLNADTQVVVYGESDNEMDAKMAASKLHDLNFANVYVLKGGLSACKNIMPLEGDSLESDNDQLLHLDNKTYVIVKNSTLTWTGENANSKHSGEISLIEGSMEVKDSFLRGEFVIDMNSIKTLDLSSEEGADILNAHLRSDDFFLTKMFSTAKYSFNHSKSLPLPYQTSVNYIIDGELSLRGIRKEQRINMLVSKVKETLVLNARVELDRTQWGIIYGSTRFFKYLGMHKIFDIIWIDIRLELR